ncbi:hypothetical protein HIM_12212 [Hirsutella minnesotensis 3608]|uniref:Uncharacterized protein n=1 Tax=Hirsutella minnesotensis 3608 TaxID=1043627 RepID=A0A0F7ZF24_9HYPO|nr:hypothetical protein HIM_12212 [Hirsutella minnesotensis 3608]
MPECANLRDHMDRSEVSDVSHAWPKDHQIDDLQALFSLMDSFTPRRTAVLNFVALHPDFMSKLFSLFSPSSTKPVEGPATPADTPSPAGQCEVKPATYTDYVDSSAVDDQATAATAPQRMGHLRRPPDCEQQTDHGALSAAACPSCSKSDAEEGERQSKTKKRKTTASSVVQGHGEDAEARKLRREQEEVDYISKVKEYGPPEVWTNLWQSLHTERGRIDALFDQSTNEPQDLQNATDGDVVAHLESLFNRSERVTAHNALGIAVRRHELRQVADLYLKYSKCRKKGDVPIAVLFAQTMLPQQAAAVGAKRLTKQETYKKLAQIWRNHIKVANRWRSLSNAFGCGFLLLLPPDLYEEAGRRLDKDGDNSIIAAITEQHPTLREDLKDLSHMFTTFCEFRCLPDKKLCLETFDRNRIPNGRAELGKLLRYHKESPGRVTDVGSTADDCEPSGSGGIDATIDPALLEANTAQYRVDNAFADWLVMGNASAPLETDELGVEDVLERSLFSPKASSG